MRTFFGVLIIAVLNSGLAAVGAKNEIKRFVTGAVIVAVVILEASRHPQAGRKFALLKRMLSWSQLG